MAAFLDSHYQPTPEETRTAMTQILRQPLAVKAAAVPREKDQTAVASAPETQAQATPSSINSLNLKLPSLQTISSRYRASKPYQAQQTLFNLFRKRNEPEIRYSAELVYDLDKGEDITGGKVNIQIPLG